jgi:hypothetical protein
VVLLATPCAEPGCELALRRATEYDVLRVALALLLEAWAATTRDECAVFRAAVLGAPFVFGVSAACEPLAATQKAM